jgi:hypothetical protein
MAVRFLPSSCADRFNLKLHRHPLLSGTLFFIVIVILVSAAANSFLSRKTPVMSITSSGFLTSLPDKVQHLLGSWCCATS